MEKHGKPMWDTQNCTESSYLVMLHYLWAMHHPFSKGDPGRNKAAKHQTPFWDKVSLSFDMIQVPFSFQ